MYTLSKAKEEIDAIATYASDIAAHALTIDKNLMVMLDAFKQEVLTKIDAKFAELEKGILGEAQPSESSAVVDLGAKVAMLKHHLPAAAPHEESGHADQGHHDQGGGGEHHG